MPKYNLIILTLRTAFKYWDFEILPTDQSECILVLNFLTSSHFY